MEVTLAGWLALFYTQSGGGGSFDCDLVGIGRKVYYAVSFFDSMVCNEGGARGVWWIV